MASPSAAHAVQPLSLDRLKTACSTCGLRELCLPVGLSGEELDRLDNLIYLRKSIKKGTSIYRAGERFDALYAVRAGFFKTTVLLEDGRDQVTGFYMGGELLGMDGIGTEKHTC
ncbi:MAG: cyclic nucleotide-binding domain-containing protein, partial [Betaproteobacteria bacterium]